MLALTVNDLDFDRKLILPRRQVDDSTRQLRELKTRKSKSPVAIAPALEAMLRNYLSTWQRNPSGLLFPNRNGRPRKLGMVSSQEVQVLYPSSAARSNRPTEE